MADEIKLPPLPDPVDTVELYRRVSDVYEPQQMKDYATQAVEAYKAQQQGEAEPVARIKGTEVLGLPLLEWLSADHSFRAPVGSLLYTHPAPAQQPLTDAQERALCEAYCNKASDEYFKARPQLESDVNRRIFYAGHRKAWIEWEAAHSIGEKK
jgi:hypothetical protein